VRIDSRSCKIDLRARRAIDARHCGLAKAKVRPWDMERAGQQYTDFFLNRADNGLQPCVLLRISKPLRTPKGADPVWIIDPRTRNG
jgi:hypothetical protein